MFFYATRRGLGHFGIPLPDRFVLSIISWALVVAIVVALLEAICAPLWVIAQKNELCDARAQPAAQVRRVPRMEKAPPSPAGPS